MRHKHGFYFRDGKAVRPTDREQIDGALAEIKDGLKDVDDPDVWDGYPDSWRPGDAEDQPAAPVGLFLNLERCTRGNPTWQMAMGIEHAFALGKIAAGKTLTPAEKVRLRALEDGWSRGGRDGGGAEQKRKAETWKAKAKPIYDQFRGSRLKGDLLWKTQVDLATLIAIEVPEAPQGDELLTAIKRWISEMDRA